MEPQTETNQAPEIQPAKPFAEFKQNVFAVAIAPDGQKIAVGLGDGRIELLDRLTRKNWLTKPNCFKGHKDRISAIVITDDGKTLISGSYDKTVRLWNAETGQQIGDALQHGDKVQTVAATPDGKYLVSGSNDQIVRLWSLESKQSIGTPFKGHKGLVWSVAISRDGKTLASASEDKTVKLWDLDSQKMIGDLPHPDEVNAVAISRDGKTLVSGSDDGSVQLWDLESRQPIGAPFKTHTETVWSVAISSDGKIIASGSKDQTVCLWDVEARRLISNAALRGHTWSVYALVISHDDKTLVSGGDFAIRLWNTTSGCSDNPFEGHEGRVGAIVSSNDGKILISGSNDKTVRLWDMESGQPIGPPLEQPSEVEVVAISSDARVLAAGCFDGTVRLWDREAGQPIGTPLEHKGKVVSLAFSHDGKTLISGDMEEGRPYLWDIQSGQRIRRFNDKVFSSTIYSLAISPDGKTLATGNKDRTVRLWDIETGQPIGGPLEHQDEVNSVAFSQDGRRLASASDDRTICLWDVSSRQIIGEPFKLDNKALSVAISADGKTLVSGDYEPKTTIRLWDLDDLEHKRFLTIGDCAGKSVVFHPNQPYILSSGEAGIRVWRWEAFEVQRIPQAFQNDQPGDQDQLAIEKELYALADVLMMRSLEPPLAVAILGGWGSGKSFGMNLIKKHITAIRCRALTEKQTWNLQDPSDPYLSPYVGHIYQIKFDAWTYAKSDLWASLMQTIFFELNRQLTLEKHLAKFGSLDQRRQLENKLNDLSKELFEADAAIAQATPPIPETANETETSGTAPTDASLTSQEPTQPPEPAAIRTFDASTITKFEVILAAGELNLETKIAQPQQDPELEECWQFLGKIGQAKRKELLAFMDQIKDAESRFLLEAQAQEFWQVLHTLNDAERNALLEGIAQSKQLGPEDIQRWQEGGGKANYLWDILGELKQKDQQNLRDTEQKLEALKQRKAQLEMQLKQKTEQMTRDRDRGNENLALVKAFLAQWGESNGLFEELSADLGLGEPEALSELKNGLSKSGDDLDKFINDHTDQIQSLADQTNEIRNCLEEKPDRQLIGLVKFVNDDKNRQSILVFILLLSLPFLIYILSFSLSWLFPSLKIFEQVEQLSAGVKVWGAALLGIPGLNEGLKIFKKITVWQSKINREFQAFQANVEVERQKLAIDRPINDHALPPEVQHLQQQIKATQSDITKLEMTAQTQRLQAGLTVQYGSLLEFVTDRLEADSYQKRLGLMHQIKHDLEDLSDRLTYDLKHATSDRMKALKTHFPRGNARIVLYIDDLDRCPPNRVVEVLEAVQLLLTTKLFIVIVAIDDRYINRALESTYQGILKRRGTPSGVDYLEKIVQIPYRMRAISEKSILESYLKSQLDLETMQATAAEPKPSEVEHAVKTIDQQHPVSQPEAKEMAPKKSDNISDNSPSGQLSDGANKRSRHAAVNPTETQLSDSINLTEGFVEIAKFTQEEFQTILDCCQYVDLTPRTTKRIINLCKILKLVWTNSGPHDTRWQEEPPLEVKQTVIAFLALSGRYPNQIRCVLEELYNQFENKQLANHDIASERLTINPTKGELLSAARERYPLGDSYMQREWNRFANDVMQVPPREAANQAPNYDPQNDRFVLEQRTFNLLLSFCFIGDVGYDPDDVHSASPLVAAQANGKPSNVAASEPTLPQAD